MSKRFVRVDTHRISKLGKSRPKLQKWRKPKGKHNKTRLKRFGYPIQVEVGFGSPRKDAGKIDGLYPMLIENMADVAKLTKNNIAIISRNIGAKKKMSIIKKLDEMKIKIQNVGGKKWTYQRKKY